MMRILGKDKYKETTRLPAPTLSSTNLLVDSGDDYDEDEGDTTYVKKDIIKGQGEVE